MTQSQSLAQVLQTQEFASVDLQSKITSHAISAPTKKTPAALALINQFGNPEQFLVAYNPRNQIRFTLNTRRAYRGAAPSLATVKAAFGYGTSLSWLVIQLFDLAEFSGCKNKFTEEQIDELAQIILEEYYYLKTTEFMDFFLRFKRGDFGRFYGSVDPMVITCALRDYLRERDKILDRLALEDRDVARASDPSILAYRMKYEQRKKIMRFYYRNFHESEISLLEFESIWWLFRLGDDTQNQNFNYQNTGL